MAKNIELKERGTNEVMYPLTHSDLVMYLENSTTLTSVLEQMNKKISELPSGGGTIEWHEE